MAIFVNIIMKCNILNYLVALSLLVLLFSCKKEKTTWDTNWAAPIAHGHLTLSDLISTDYQATNADNYLSIVYQESVYSFSVDTLIDLPDTTIQKKLAVNVPNLTVSPGFTYGDAYDQAYVLDQIELKEVIVSEGTVEMGLRSPWPGKTKVTINFPKIFDAGIPFLREFFLEAGTMANPATGSAEINMQGFKLDLTGVSGNLFNTISGDITVASDETVNTFDITNQDSIEYDLTFRDMLPYYARGYFGSYLISDTTGINLPFMDNVLGGMIDIDSIDLNIVVKNGFNLIAQSKITLIEGINSTTGTTVPLTFPMLNNNININPASGGLYDYVPSEYPLSINNSNSNVNSFIENLSDSILLGYELFINPYGNVTGGSDELFPGSTMDIFLDAEFPLSFGANDLAITDTFSVAYSGNTSYSPKDSEIILDYENGFPIEASASFYLLDENNTVISTILADTPIASGTYNAGDYSTSSHKGATIFSLTEQDLLNLESAEQIAFIVSFTTDNGQKIKVNADAFFDFNLRTNLNLTLQL